MFVKSKTSAFLLILAFAAGWAAGYLPVQYLLNGVAPYAELPPLGTILLGLGIILTAIYFASRSDLVMGLGDIGFGLGGLARWGGAGLLSGLLVALANAMLLRWLGETSRLRDGLELLLDLLLFGLVYRAVFQRSPLSSPVSGGASRRASIDQLMLGSKHLFLFGGLVVTFAGLLGLILTIVRGAPFSWMILATIGMGASLLAIGVAVSKEARSLNPRITGRLMVFAVILFLLCLVGMLVWLAG